MVELADIIQARENVKGFVHRTALRKSTTFSRLTDGEVHLKLENQQRTGSFKIRGALNKMKSLSREEAERGVIAASAGNHAQGVALAATSLGIRSTICMPKSAPFAKVEATRGYGATVVQHGRDYNEAFERALELQEDEGFTFVHAFDDAAIIAGQGTVGLEIHEQLPDVDTVVVAVGGGGLISGVATALKALKPDVRVIGVETEGAASAHASRAAGRVVRLESLDTIADGIATKSIGKLTFGLIEQYVDDLVLVSDSAVSHAILMLLERSKTVVEGAGAVALAALLSGKVDVKGKKAVAVVSGGNIDMDFLGQIIRRGLMEEGRILRFTSVIPDKPGALKGLLDAIAGLNGNIITVQHDRDIVTLPLNKTLVDIEIETRGQKHLEELVHAIEAAGYAVEIQVGA
ncbi:MAG: threonine ammonia-lyase [Euryarchaeota archaeon]|nr:threonine ammonia-lyase [Euryarchaeota archaeon]